LPVEAKPLFRLDALRTKLAAFTLPATAASAQQKLAHWTVRTLLSAGSDKFRQTTEERAYHRLGRVAWRPKAELEKSIDRPGD
jgi:hypothetical protein